MPGFDFLFGTDTTPAGTQPTGYAGMQYSSLDDARKSFLPEGGLTTFDGITGSPRQIYDEGKRRGWSRDRLERLVREKGR